MRTLTLVEFYDELAEQALGWLGWTEEQALSADVNTIQVAMSGRVAMFAAIFGASDEPVAGPQLPRAEQMSPSLFDQVFG